MRAPPIEATWPVAQTALDRRLHEENALPAREVWRRIACATGEAPAGGKFPDALRAVVEYLDASRRPSEIIGGIAVISHGSARSTASIDATLAAESSQSAHLVGIARRFSLRPRIEDAEAFARENLVLLLEHAPTRVRRACRPTV